MSINPVSVLMSGIYGAVSPALSLAKRCFDGVSEWAAFETTIVAERERFFTLSGREIERIDYGDYIDLVIEMGTPEVKLTAQRIRECLADRTKTALNLENLRLRQLPEYLVTGITRGYFRHVTSINLAGNSFTEVPSLLRRIDCLPALAEVRI